MGGACGRWVASIVEEVTFRTVLVLKALFTEVAIAMEIAFLQRPLRVFSSNMRVIASSGQVEPGVRLARK